MTVIYYCLVLAVCIDVGNSLGSTKSQSPSEERFSFFDAELLQVFNKKTNGNFLLSPLSVKFVLGMLMEGSEGKAAREIRTALRLPEEEEARRKEFDTWSSLVQVKGSPIDLKIANRMFLSDRCSLDPDFGKTLKGHYSGGVTRVRFENAREATKAINGWVGNQTSHLVSDIVEEGQITKEDKLVLASVVYFKGVWENPFATERTAVRCFYPKDNKCKDSFMMIDTGYFEYGFISRLDAQAIALPYKGGRFSMLILLPSKRDGIEELSRDLVHVSLKSILSEMDKEEVFIQIPRFEIAYNEDLVESLKKVQISQVFGQNANFSKVFAKNSETAFVGHVFHSTKIVVNEEGTEAAAATGALFVPLMGGTTTSFVANHPFLFFVLEPTKPLILFAGKVFSPQVSAERENGRPKTDQPPIRTILPESSGAAALVHGRPIHAGGVLKSSNSSTKISKEPKPNQRVQSGVPKFRSIKPSFSNPLTLSSSSAERGISADQIGNSFLHAPLRKMSVSRPAAFYEKRSQEQFLPNSEKVKKRGKNSQDLKKVQTEDWRHHVLFFT